MKLKAIIPTLLFGSILLVNSALAGNPPTPAELRAQAKVTEAKAREIALAKAPKGTIQSSELEEEHNRLIWSFDISTPNTQDIIEVAVDAKTGAVVSVEIETPKDQAKEAAEDKEETKPEKK